ncbi:acyl-CoA dehydrogenase family protein [Staphylococcus xylosus]|uniref:acyl-CoA dehydrogenase family protein n=1 Tax=Staphylococcus xylosus TaxID=1288 RepID=UPI003F57ED54
MGLINEKKVYKEELISLLESKKMNDLLYNCRNSAGEFNPISIYQELGKKNMLSPNFPPEYGGLGLSFEEVALLLETMNDFGIPESLHVLSTIIVGNLILLSGTDKQKNQFLPNIANGKHPSVILYSEPLVGSNLSNLSSIGEYFEGYYYLSGKKVYSMKTHIAHYGLTAVKTSNTNNNYDNITLFMVPLNSDGVTINEIPSIGDESLYEVILENVKLDKTFIIGEINHGWNIINNALTLERTGIDYIIRAKRWIQLIEKKENISQYNLIRLAKLKAKLSSTQKLSYYIIRKFDETNSIDESLTAMSKYYSSELAKEIINVGHSILGSNNLLKESETDYLGTFESAFREAPGITISAGTSEVLLESISKFKLTNNSGDDSL